MKRRKYITTLSLIVALTGLSAVVAADAVRTSMNSPKTTAAAKPQLSILSSIEMDRVHGGMLNLGVIQRNILGSGGCQLCKPGDGKWTPAVWK